MTDMLVALSAIPDHEERLRRLRVVDGIAVKRALAFERVPTLRMVEAVFGLAWADETNAAFMHTPTTCFIATHEGAVVGFSNYDATALGFLGPMGVAPDYQKKGIGAILALVTLHAMRQRGYGYAVIGGVGPADFYEHVAGAVLINGSDPGIYADRVTQMLPYESSLE